MRLSKNWLGFDENGKFKEGTIKHGCFLDFCKAYCAKHYPDFTPSHVTLFPTQDFSEYGQGTYRFSTFISMTDTSRMDMNNLDAAQNMVFSVQGEVRDYPYVPIFMDCKYCVIFGEIAFAGSDLLDVPRFAESGIMSVAEKISKMRRWQIEASFVDLMQSLMECGSAASLINDDNGHWAIGGDGVQNVPEERIGDISTSFWIEKTCWSDTVAGALKSWASSVLSENNKDDSQIV